MTFELIHKADVVASAPDRWIETYKNFPESSSHRDKSLRLGVLADGFTAKEVEYIIGNDSWTTLRCGECRKDSDTLVQIGDEHESVQICRSCLNHATNLMKEAK